jgi:transmembrane sensor
MTDPAQKIVQAARLVDVTWDERTRDGLEASIVAGVERRRVRRKRMVSAAALGAVVLAIVVVLRFPFGHAVVAHSSFSTPAPSALGELVLGDGSHVNLSANAELTELKGGGADLTLALRRGSAHFEVVPRRSGKFRVVTDAVVVEVIGTAFTVERSERSVRVAVEHGVVRVTRGEESATLGAGEARSFELTPPEEKGAQTAETPEDAPPDDLADAGAMAQRTTAGGKEWRHLAREGDFEGAYRVLQRQKHTVRDEPGDLMLEADIARMSGHPSEAIAPLRRLMNHYPKDPRASLAAFTLGRVLLEEVGDPHGAAQAFESARRLQPKGPLDESALSRAVEAWSRAGEPGKARSLANEYYRLYPNGEKTRLVKRYTESL